MKEQALKINGINEVDDTRICYWKDEDGLWFIYLPSAGVGAMSKHEITENENGTITVRPSILLYGHKNGEPSQRHGYLTNGIWTEC
jgi:hypothetical protein